MAEEAKKKKKHLARIVTEQAHDGSYVHHHTYKPHRDDPHEEAERRNVATSATPEEAGQHTAEQFGMNEPPPDAGAGAGDPGAGAGGGDAGAVDPAAAAQ